MQASFPNPEEIVRPGQFARIRAELAAIEDGIMIPQRCVSEIQGIYRVFLCNENNEIEIREVTPFRKKGNMWIIEKGLQAGDKVVIEGIQRARTGFKINPIAQEFEYIDQENQL
jgi:membrane fusion protein (multidrug efflux system)